MNKGQFVGKYSHFIMMLGLGVTLGVLFSASPALALCIPGIPCISSGGAGISAGLPRSCDAKFMNQMTARAALEAQREMLTNQHYIAKADSVLEYSCFDKLASNAATTLPPLFSGTDNWDGHSVPLTGGIAKPRTVTLRVNMGETHGDSSFENAVLKPIKTYIDNNFSHSFLGGKISKDSDMSASLSGGITTCDHMGAIWHVAKCDDMTANPFTDFEALTSSDPRIDPASCGGSNINPATIAMAQNAAPSFTYASFDKVETHFDALKPPGSKFAPSCGTAFATGVRFPMTVSESVGANNVATRQVEWLDEYICPNPSCHYDRSEDECVP